MSFVKYIISKTLRQDTLELCKGMGCAHGRAVEKEQVIPPAKSGFKFFVLCARREISKDATTGASNKFVISLIVLEELPPHLEISGLAQTLCELAFPLPGMRRAPHGKLTHRLMKTASKRLCNPGVKK